MKGRHTQSVAFSNRGRAEALDPSVTFPKLPPPTIDSDESTKSPPPTYVIAPDTAAFLRRRAEDLNCDPAAVLNDLLRIERRRAEGL